MFVEGIKVIVVTETRSKINRQYPNIVNAESRYAINIKTHDRKIGCTEATETGLDQISDNFLEVLRGHVATFSPQVPWRSVVREGVGVVVRHRNDSTRLKHVWLSMVCAENGYKENEMRREIY